MSDTPDTDAQSPWRYSITTPNGVTTHYVPADFARKLERERNNLQDQRDFAMSEIERLRKQRDEARDTISDVLRALGAMEHEGPRLAALRVKEERDQARRELDIQLESIKFHMERVPVMQLSLEAQRDFCMGEIERLRKERDEARALQSRPQTVVRFEAELRELINKNSIENFTDMPDFLLAKMIGRFIEAVGPSIKDTLDWHGCNSVCHPASAPNKEAAR